MKIALLSLLALAGALANPMAKANAEAEPAHLAKRATCTYVSLSSFSFSFPSSHHDSY